MDDQDPNNQVITIDSEISRILGLEDNFDLDPDEYLQLVRAKLVEYDILAGSKNITPEQQEEQRILASQVREIRAQKRTGNIKYNTGKVAKKINKDAFFNKKPEETKEPEKRIVDPSKLLPGTIKTGEIVKSKTQRVEDLKREKPEEENKGLFTIQKILNSILDNLKNQFKFDQKKTDEQRREKETKKREKRESGLEKGFAMVKSAVKKMLAPFQNILDQIFKYFFFTFLGKMFTDLMNWLSDPKNKKKVEVLGRFLKDWWPLLLGAYLMFASPLGLFIKGALKMIGGLTSQILKLLPRLLNLSKSLVTSRPARAAGSALLNVVRSPFVWFPAAVAGTAALANEITGQRKAAPVQAQNRARAQAGEGLGLQGVGGVGDMGPTTPYGMLQGIRRGGIIRGYSNGAKVEDGYSGIDSDTGVSITGAGRDTQLIAARPGEVVLTPEDAGVIQERTGFDVYNFVKNRKPSYTNFNNIKMSGGIPLANSGGILGFNNGGIVGGKPKTQNPPISLSDYYSLLAISAIEDDKPQGRADVAQSIYNRLYAANKYNSNFSQSNNTIKNLITAPNQYRPTFTNSADWMSIKDKRSAAIAIMNSEKGRNHKWTMKDAMDQLSATESAIKNPSFQAAAQKHVGGRAYFLGTSQQDNMKPGDVLRGKDYNFFSPWYMEGTQYDKERRNIAAPIPQMLLPQEVSNRSNKLIANKQNPFQKFASSIFNLATPPTASAKPGSNKQKPKRWAIDPRGWFGMQGGGEVPQGPFTPLPSPGYVRPQGSFIPKPILRLPGPMPGSTLPFGWNPFIGLQGGGSIKENTGMNIPGTADRQLTALQPGEYVLPVDTVNKLGVPLINRLVADTDSNSTPAKLGFRNKSINIKPPQNRLNNTIMAPPIKTSASGGMKGSSAANSQNVYAFNPVLETSGSVRKMHVDMYGILD